MQRVPVNMLRADMVVARQVVNDNGVVLVNAGAVLTDKMIERLKNLGVKKAMVMGQPVDMAPHLAKTLQEKLSDMEYGLKFCTDDPLMQKYRVLLKAHLIKRHNELTGKAPDPPLPDADSSQGGLDTDFDI